MKIRDELRQKGLTDEEIDNYVYEAFERQAYYAIYQKEEYEKKIKPSPIVEYFDKLMNRLSWILFADEVDKSIPPYTGDKNNPIELYDYYQKYDILPIETIENEDGTYTYIYEGGLKVNCRVNLSGFPTLSDDIQDDLKLDNKRLLADILNIDEAKALSMSDKKLNKLVLKKEKSIIRKY